MNTFKVAELKKDTRFTDDLVLDKTFLLLNRGARMSGELIQALKDWQFTEVHSEGGLFTGAQSIRGIASQPGAGLSRGQSAGGGAAREGTGGPGSLQGAAGAVGFEDMESRFDFSSLASEQERLDAVQRVYDGYLDFVFDVFTYYATHKKIDLDSLSYKVKELCFFVKANRRYVLQVHPNHDKNPKNFLIGHSLRSTVLAITVGLQLHMSMIKMTELGVACILHEIGMIRIPSQFYLTRRNLSPAEKNLLNTHPVISYTILKDLNAPQSVCLAALEHHEKEDGSGYPRRIHGDKISLYAKIISVVCSFEARTAPRIYKAPVSSFEAMVELLQNQTKQYDELVIKALLYSLSLFPVGSYVFLSDGKVGRVVDVNPENPKYPIVQLIAERDANGNPISVKTDEKGLRIVRGLNKKETADIVKSVQSV